MPLYQYACKECGTEIDKMFKIADRKDQITEYCQNCQQETPHEYHISAVAMSYNGVNHGHKIPTDLKNRFDQLRKHYPKMRSQY